MNKTTLLLALCALGVFAGCGDNDPPQTKIAVRLIGPAKFTNESVEEQMSAITSDHGPMTAQPTPTSMRALLLHKGLVYETIDPVDLTGPAHNTDYHHPTAGQFGQARQAVGDGDGIIGTDQRFRSPNGWPASAAVEIRFTGATGSCSATLIGPHTIITAAHCFYNPQNHVWYDTAFFAPGADVNEPGKYPWGTYWSFSVWIPSGYNRPADQNDFAFVDISASGSPFPSDLGSGWMGTVVTRMDDERGFSGLQRAGYDSDKQIPGGDRPQQWSSQGIISPACFDVWGTPDPYDCQQFAHNLDTYNGASGSGVFWFVGPNAYHVMGVHTANQYFGGFINSNLGTSWQPWTYNFVHQHDTHWP